MKLSFVDCPLINRQVASILFRARLQRSILSQPLNKPHAFPALDAMRGTAALAVVQLHQWKFFGVLLFPRGYLAVDFFFLLSGFVLSFAYQEKIDRNGFTWTFLKTRFARLYPLYIAGSVIGLVQMLIMLHTTPGEISKRSILMLVMLAVVLVPAPPSIPYISIEAFPLDMPAWSLFGESVANILHALILKRRSTKSLCVIAALLFLSVAYFAHRNHGMAFGWDRADIYLSLTRVMFSYVLGMLLYRLHRSGRVTFSLPPTLSCLLLLGLLALPLTFTVPVRIELVCVAVVFPLLLIMSVRSTPSPGFARSASLLGQASYAVYILHIPMGAAFARVWFHLRHVQAEHDAPWSGIVYLALVIGLALVLDVVYDLPVRRWLMSHLVRRVSPSTGRTAGGRLIPGQARAKMAGENAGSSQLRNNYQKGRSIRRDVDR